jgi:retinol-binding protein 3
MGKPHVTEATPRDTMGSQAINGARDMTAEVDTFDAGVIRDVVERLASELAAVHVVPEFGAKLAASLRERLQSDAYLGATSAAKLAALLTGELQAASKDKHSSVFFSTEPPLTPRGGLPPPDAVEDIRKANGGIERVEILDGNIGYLKLWGVPILEGSREAVADAFALLHDTEALILDNRGNKGGDPRTVALYLSYLAEGEPFVFNEIHWREGGKVEKHATMDLGALSYGVDKPVYVLTSSATFSGGEALVYHLQAMKRAVVVGEATAG